MKRVLVVDDSAFARKLIKDILGSTGELTVVDTAANGRNALEKLETTAPDVITLDVEMPEMNGLETLAAIMKIRPTPVVMLSSSTTEGKSISVSALELGAVDVVAKPIAHGLPQLKEIADELIYKVVAASNIEARKLTRRSSGRRHRPIATPPHNAGSAFPIVVIASSTGGPRALRYLVPRLPVDRGAFYLIIQHLPIGFTAPMARDLNEVTALTVREAASGDHPKPDLLLIAPAGKHCAFSRHRRIQLTDDPPLWGVRPAADISMTTAGTVFGNRVIGVILTGMGRDGAHGLGIIKDHGGITIAEHESSCVIYGMPKAAIESGAAQQVATLEAMPDAIASALDKISRSIPR